jgi:hypothetical protein
MARGLHRVRKPADEVDLPHTAKAGSPASGLFWHFPDMPRCLKWVRNALKSGHRPVRASRQRSCGAMVDSQVAYGRELCFSLGIGWWGELSLNGGEPRRLGPMSELPVHLQRRFEQRWASRFAVPVAASAPKNTGMKAEISKSAVAGNNLTAPIAVAISHYDGRAVRCRPRGV